MRALVVFESVYGNTQQIAAAIALGLSAHPGTELFEVGGAPHELPDDVGLVVVGGPTHAFGMSTADSRRQARQKADAAPVSRTIGQREWLETVQLDRRRVSIATFDTRIGRPRFFWGSAALHARDRLQRRELNVIDAESFYLHGPFGPVTNALLPGELERARAWGARLAVGLSSSPTDAENALVHAPLDPVSAR